MAVVPIRHARQASTVFLAITVALMTAPLRADAQENIDTMLVATREVPPFAFRSREGEWTGVVIELWRQIADELNLRFEYRNTDIDEMTSGLSEGRYGAAVAALTMTAEREAQFDFTHPFYNGGLGIAVKDEQTSPWLGVARRILSLRFLEALLALVVLLLAVGLVVWFVERRRNSGQFGGSATEGIGAGFWWSAVTMTTVGYGDKAPVTVAGRLVALVWMFASIIVISSFTAAIASALTVSQLEAGIAGPEDLPGLRVGVLAESTSEAYLNDRDVRTVAFETAPKALDALEKGVIDAVVYDAAILRYWVNRAPRGKGLHVLTREFAPQEYAIGLPADSVLREPINQIILRETNSREWHQRLSKYESGHSEG